MRHIVSLAAKALLSGDVVVLPTETVYGLAALINSEAALRKIFEIKGRPFCDPLIVHILDYSWVVRCAFMENRCHADVLALVDAFWPGPLTIVLKKTSNIPDIVTSGLDSVALRCPSHEMFRRVLKLTNIPIAAPSANPFGYLSPTTAKHVMDTLGDKVDLIVDGGPCAVGVESTILDMTGDILRVARPGVVSANDIATVLNCTVLDYNPRIKIGLSPGQLSQHYSPNTKLVLFGVDDDATAFMASNEEKNVAFVFLKKPDLGGDNVFWLSEKEGLHTAASKLFSVLQTLDRLSYDVIYCQCAENVGVGIAINDRLKRAAAKFLNLN